ncbi:MAG TPA: hypothetical protein VGP25_10355 [Gemmatimonadaceae bacterium]|nr:hypothetical protein [Gemmatimonadaceae bacterium]
MSISLFAAGRRAHGVRVAAALALMFGYADLVRGGITVAPVLLVLSYLCLVPLAILGE